MQAVEYKIHPSVLPFHNSHAQVKALCGPVGSGKSSASCWEVFFSMRESEIALRWLVVRESYRQLHDSTRRTWDQWFGHCSNYLKTDEKMLVTVENTEGVVLTHELDFRHARRPEEASNLLSTEYAGVWLEEPVPAYQFTEGVIGAGLSKELFDVVQMRLRQAGAHRLHVLLSFNPPHRYHWVYEEFFTKTAAELEALDYALFKAPAFENTANLPPGYYQRLLQRLDPELARRFVLGEPVTLYPGVRVFPEAYERIHFRERLNVVGGIPLVIGFDFGLTPCAVIAQALPAGRLQVYKEIQMFNAGVERLAEALAEELKDDRYMGITQWRCWGDPAGAARAQTDEKTCFDILGSKGFDVTPGAIDWESRRQSVKQRLERTIDGEPAILFDRNGAPVLTEGLLGGYRYPRSTDGRIANKPLKNTFSHTNDALQYIATGEYSVTSGVPLQNDRNKVISLAERRRLHNPLADNPRVPSGGGWMAS